MLNDLPLYMIEYLGITVLIETLFALVLGLRKKGDILLVVLVNIMTNPVVVCFGFLSGFLLGSKVRMACMVVLELSAFAAEGYVYKKTLVYKKLNPFLLSLLLNAASYLTGLLLNTILY